jgi:hypothetical protein
LDIIKSNLYDYLIRISPPSGDQSYLAFIMVGSYLGHYPLDLGEKNPAALDYFSRGFTFKVTPPKGSRWGE